MLIRNYVFDILIVNTQLVLVLKTCFINGHLGTTFVTVLKVLKMAKILGCYSWYQIHSLSELGLDHSTPRLKLCMLESKLA